MEQYLGLIIAIVGTGATFIAAMIAMFLWSRSESRTDLRELRSETGNMIKAIQAEIKDFHNRLLEIEKSRK